MNKCYRLLWCISAFAFAFACAIAISFVFIHSKALARRAQLSYERAELSQIIATRGMPDEGVILTASLKKNAIAPGDSDDLSLLLRNNGKQEPCVAAEDWIYDFPIVIQNSNGQLVQRRVSRGPIQIFSGLPIISGLPPDTEGVSYGDGVTGYFDATKVGIYRINSTAIVFTPDAQHQGQVVSSSDIRKRGGPYAWAATHQQSHVVSNTVILTVSNDVSKDFSLSASLKDHNPFKEAVVAPGTPIVLQLAIKNISKRTTKTVPVSESGGEYTLTVQDFRGDVLPLKKDAPMAVPDNAQLTPKTLQRGASALSTLRVDTLYDLSREGRYFITAMRHVPDGQGKDRAEVYANTVVVTVKQAAQSAAK
jgi:hypothetical protein